MRRSFGPWPAIVVAVAEFGLLPRDSSLKDKARYETVQKEVESSLGHDRAEFLPLVRLVKRLQGCEIRD